MTVELIVFCLFSFVGVQVAYLTVIIFSLDYCRRLRYLIAPRLLLHDETYEIPTEANFKNRAFTIAL